MRIVKKIIKLNLFLSGLIFLSIAFIDRPLSVLINDHFSFLKPFFYSFTLIADNITVSIIWILLLSLGFGLLFLFSSITKKLGFVLLATVFTLLAAAAITNIMKFEFKRARPEVYLNSKSTTNDFYNKAIKDYSFPSSHTSFYLSLFLPAALVYRRYAPVLLFIPAVIIVGRVVQNEHYLSDVLCSILIVFDLCVLILGVFYLMSNKLNSNIKFAKTIKSKQTIEDVYKR